jgi:hypothetical protein
MKPEQCDTCGAWVGEGYPDPDWDTHNSLHYMRHVFISHPYIDALRIAQQHFDALNADLSALRASLSTGRSRPVSGPEGSREGEGSDPARVSP